MLAWYGQYLRSLFSDRQINGIFWTTLRVDRLVAHYYAQRCPTCRYVNTMDVSLHLPVHYHAFWSFYLPSHTYLPLTIIPAGNYFQMALFISSDCLCAPGSPNQIDQRDLIFRPCWNRAMMLTSVIRQWRRTVPTTSRLGTRGGALSYPTEICHQQTNLSDYATWPCETNCPKANLYYVCLLSTFLTTFASILLGTERSQYWHFVCLNSEQCAIHYLCLLVSSHV